MEAPQVLAGALAALLPGSGCALPPAADADGQQRQATARFATFNVYLNRPRAGQLRAELGEPGSAQPRAVAEILQRVRPDVVLLQEFDHDDAGEAVELFRRNYLGVAQNGAVPIDYPFVFLAPSNTGVDSGFDLDHDGRRHGPGDAIGFGAFPGQYGMVLLSRFPIDCARSRTFREFRWKDMPGAALPPGWFTAEQLGALRLSSKSHWDVVVMVHGTPVHVLCAHPTPPVFDGPEDRNGRRNHDEIRFFADYITSERSGYIADDRGRRGGLAAGDHFVILGDYNADPRDGDSRGHAIAQLLEHPLVHRGVAPLSLGAVAAAQRRGGVDTKHKGDPALDTGSFGPRVGNLRLDYVLPSRTMRVVQGGVFWPAPGDPLFRLVGDGAAVVSSDHRLVWVDAELPR